MKNLRKRKRFSMTNIGKQDRLDYDFIGNEFGFEIRFYDFRLELDGNEELTVIYQLEVFYKLAEKFLEDDEFFSDKFCEISKLEHDVVSIYIQTINDKLSKKLDEDGINPTVRLPNYADVYQYIGLGHTGDARVCIGGQHTKI